MEEKKPILLTEEAWRSSQLSIARFYGSINFNGCKYIIVDKKGRDLFECSAEAVRAGRDKAIEPGEPADLIREEFKSIYKKLGRDAFIKVLEEHPEINSAAQMRQIVAKEGNE